MKPVKAKILVLVVLFTSLFFTHIYPQYQTVWD